MQESNQTDEKHQIEEDKTKLENMFNYLGLTNLPDFKRIGKRGAKPRPILLKFHPNNIENRAQLLAKSKNLKNAEKEIKFFVKPDLTKKEQEESKKLYTELIKLRSENPNNTYYINKGVVTIKSD